MGREKDPLSGLISKTARLISRARSLVVFTGAGISTGAGIPDFRGEKGIYTTGRYPPDVFDIETFLKEPGVFYSYAREFVEHEKNIQPTFTHGYFAALEKRSILKHVITQNIDGLHQKAGSRDVLEMHGGYGSSRCMSCGKTYSYEEFKDKLEAGPVPRCENCGGVIKPDIVFFGEPIRGFEEAKALVAGCDLLLVAGTSLNVYPAAFLPEIAKGDIIIVNKGGVKINTPGSIMVDSDIDVFFTEVSKLTG